MSKELMKQPRKGTSLQNIIASYVDERQLELTPFEEEKKKQYEAAFTMLIEDDSIIDTVLKLEQLYDVSKATAYRIVNESETIFGSVKKFNKEAWRFIQIERKRKLITLATQDKNYELAAKLERDIDNLIGFDKAELGFNPDKLKATEITVKVSPAFEKLVLQMNNKGSVDLNNLEAEDINFEDVKDA